jgi:hypothetical protein
MSLAGSFKRTVDVFVASRTSVPAVKAYLADQAQVNAQALIDAGRASPRYRKFVNGVENADPTTIRLDGTGTIAYLFASLNEAAGYALTYAINHSPEKSGRYRASWFLLVNGQPFTGADLRDIPLGAEVVLSNFQPYHRKIDVGGMRMSVAPQIVEQTRQAVLRRYPSITAERKFITIPGGYVLQRHGVRSGLHYDKKRKTYARLHPPQVSGEADRRAGQVMTYPSLVMYEAI